MALLGVSLFLQEPSHLVPLLLQESSLHFSFLLKLFWFTLANTICLCHVSMSQEALQHSNWVEPTKLKLARAEPSKFKTS